MQNLINNNVTSGKANVFAIHEDFYPEIEKKLNRIIRKCEKYGNPFTFNVIGEDMRNEKKDKSGAWHKFILVEVSGTARIDNWEFVATLNIHESGNVVRRFNTDVEIPDCYKTSANVCDHCKSARPRKNLYLIRNTETGEFKQVGGSCLKSYSGIDLEYIVAWIDGLTKLEKSDGLYYGEGGKTYYSVEEVISYASTIINKVGYFRNDPYSLNLSTKAMVCTMLRSDIYASTVEKKVEILNKQLKDHLFEVQFSASEFSYNKSEVQSIIDYYQTCEDDSEFTHNVKVILNDGFASYKDLGYICYLPQGYAKHIEREVERAKRLEEKREHFGEIGKRYKDVPVQSVRQVACYETMYGIMRVWQIVTKDGVVLTWKTNNFADENATSVTFTIKEHGEYKNVPQTIVTRCKFVA